MSFRRQLLDTLHAVQPLLGEDGVLVIGSEVPNLLENEAASTLVVSKDVDIGIAVERHQVVKARLPEIKGLAPSSEEPSVWVPRKPGLIEVNFVGMDSRLDDASQSYILDDPELPLMVFGALSYMRPRPPIEVEGLSIPVPRTAGLMLEKLLTERSGEKGDRDLLVVLGLLATAGEDDLDELGEFYRRLRPELRHAVRSNLSILSLMEPHQGMPDPRPHRRRIAALIESLERLDEGSP